MIYIAVHCMPWEIGEFRNQMRMMRLALKSLTALQQNKFTLIASLTLSDSIINWEESSLSREYCIEQFRFSDTSIEDLIPVVFRIGETVSTTDALRKNIREIFTDNDQLLWLDPDISFPELFFCDLLDALDTVYERTPYFIVSPTTVRLWDSSWDILVRPEELAIPLGYGRQNSADFTDFFHRSEPSLDPLTLVKLAGGWGNLISCSLLKKFDVPDSYAIYGGIDTYIEFGAEFLRKKGLFVQYRLNGCSVMQDIRFSDKELLKKSIPPRFTKDEQRAQNQTDNGVFHNAVLDLIRRLASEY